MLSSRRHAARNRRFRSFDDTRNANTLRPGDPSSRRNSAFASNRNGRGVAIRNSDVVVRDENPTVLDSHVDFSYGRSFPPGPRVSEPAGNPRKAEAAAGPIVKKLRNSKS